MKTFPFRQYYKWMTLAGILLFVLPALAKTYFLLPFPGSQDLETIRLAYYLEQWLIPLRVLAILLLVLPVANSVVNGKVKGRIGMFFLLVLCAATYYASDVYMRADSFFKEPQSKSFVTASENKISPDALVTGVIHNGEARAYPVFLTGYHHKVQDTLGGKAILVTYCTMCRTGRVFDPIVNGVHQQFRLVGARHFNAVIEDEETGSWWYQATGNAVVGPREGAALTEVPSEQMTLREWLALYPQSTVMQRDPAFTEQYDNLDGYDRMQRLVKDSVGNAAPWQRGAWVVGIDMKGKAKAYQWSDLSMRRALNDEVGGTPVVIMVAKDTMSFASWNRTVDGTVLTFKADTGGSHFRDNETSSLWTFAGECIEGKFAGKKLMRVQSYQEYWHSWKQFHANTEQWKS